MALPPDPKVIASLKKLSDRINFFIVCMGVTILAGWLFRIRVLTSIIPQWPPTRPVTAFCLILSGISLTLLNESNSAVFKKRLTVLGYSLAALIITIALFELTLYFTHIHFSLENSIPAGHMFYPLARNMRLSILSCVCFLCLGLALIAVRHGFSYAFLQVASIIIGIPALVEILDYFFWRGDVYLFSAQKRGLPTALGFFLLSLSILFARPEFGWMSVVSSDTSGGKILRKLLTRILLLIIAFAELGYTAQQYNMINLETNIILSTVIPLIITTFVMLRVARDLGTEDIKRRQAEQRTDELNQSLIIRTEQLEESNEELEQIIKVTSHDLTEPVKTISTYSDLILTKYGDKLDGDAATYLNFLKTSAERTRNILKDVLTYGTIRKAGTLETCDCNQMVNEVLSDLKDVIDSNQAKVNVTPLPTLMCYKKLKLVFHHLIHNAIKFKKAEVTPEINISCASKDDKWHFSIADNGIGIEPQYFEKIFNLFQKLHPRHKFDGSGMGLALSKKIVGFHDGDIWVESKPNDGSTFHFTLSKTLKHDEKNGTSDI